MKSKSFNAAVCLAVIISGAVIRAFACGTCFPNNILDRGDEAVLQPPMDDFGQELERMKLPSPETHVVSLLPQQQFYEQSADVEMNDLAAALKHEKVSSEQATVIMQAHLAERMKLNQYLAKQHAWSSFREWVQGTNGEEHLIGSTNPPPPFPDISVTPGLPREFTLYFQGAIDWYKSEGWQPCESWRSLLNLPETQRHFKSTWAAFMLAIYHQHQTNAADDDEAMKRFEQVRTLAKDGFADSAGLAMASIGGEARIFLHRKDYERALELYLEQFAAGESTATDSLRYAVAATMNENGATKKQLQSLAKNPRTRRTITAWLISRRLYNNQSEAAIDPDTKTHFNRTDNWLEAVESAGVKDVECAEELALAAYQAGDMNAARRWINRSAGSTVAEWLQAKLDMRDGKIETAAKLLVKVSREFPQEAKDTNAPESLAQNLSVEIDPVWRDTISSRRQVLGELGALRLSRREYTEALDALLRSGYWMDAAYVGECVLTTDELKAYVDRNWPPVSAAVAETEEQGSSARISSAPRVAIRYLLARRLARANEDSRAQAYYPPYLGNEFNAFATELRAGRETNLPPGVRATNFFAAAVMMRTNGMDLFGTDIEPDYSSYGGDYYDGFGWKNRVTNVHQSKINVADPDEAARVLAHHIQQKTRYHYRYDAAALAWEAAQLMPNNSDVTARMLCTGGTWLKICNPQAADKFYKALVRRCRKTALGQQADLQRWFPAQPIDGGLPRLETIPITTELTNNVYSNSINAYEREFPMPGQKYSVNEDEDVYVIARAVQRLGLPMRAEDVMRANPGLKRGPIGGGKVIVIPEVVEGGTNSSR